MRVGITAAAATLAAAAAILGAAGPALADGHDDDLVDISKFTNAPSFASHNWGNGNWNSAARFGDLAQD